ncbi:MAG: hypothetical protein KAR11_04710 [Phycisphaerae bacterium]|nr:hypothetical protein [Phycisphaerae bacterium]
MKAIRNQNRSSQALARGGAGNRGSAMLLAVGLVTILAMLGTTFLLISRMNRRTSEATVAQTSVDHLAAGIVSQVVTKLTEGLYIAPSGTTPYSGIATNLPTPTNAEQWLRFIDYAGDADGMNKFLYYKDDDTEHLSNVLGTGAAGGGPIKYTSVDSDAEGATPNAYLVKSYVMNSGGQTYKVAVQVIDTSSLINVNIACDGLGTPPLYGSPVEINMSGLLNGKYTELNDVRRNDQAGDPININENIALHLSSPTNDYKAFGIGNESYLRWLEDGNSRTETGKLFDAVEPLAAADRQYLTTYNASRAIVRHPTTGFTTQAMLDVSTTNVPDVLPVITYREAAYEQMKAYLTELGVGGDASKMAAHFVANLWAYTSTDDPTTEPFRYEPATGVIVYGLIPQLVIAEAYACSVKENMDTALPPVGYGDNGWAYAIELYNPSKTHAINPSTYSLKVGSSSAVTFASLGITNPISAGDRVVLYNLGGKDPTELNSPRTVDANTVPANVFPNLGAEWYLATGLDFSGTTVEAVIFRTVGGYDIPVDQVSNVDIGYSCTNKVTDADQIRYGQRDDGLTTGDNRARSTVAVMKVFSTGATIIGHKLGAANGLDIAETDIVTATTLSPEIAAFPVPILRPGTSITNLGDSANIYFTGPDDTRAFPQQLVQPTFKAVFPDGPARGRLDFHPAYYATAVGVGVVPAPGWNGGKYPDVPAAAMLSEFFNMIPPDGTKVYGRININTATPEVLKQLPWPSYLDLNGDGVRTGINEDLPPTYINDIVDYIVSYRDQKNVPVTGGPRYAATPVGLGRAAATGIGELRADPTAGSGSDCGGFLAAGELAVPLADYTIPLLSTAGIVVTDANYLTLRDSLYSAVSNLITVNSDTYVVNIKIQSMEPGAADDDDPKYVWYYTTFIDRSSCTADGAVPAILLNNMSYQE